ncbi:FAD-dependent oxidoreductase [Salinisphaera orenii MK-B5]|uniref:FAD-dependent oxidoreductase n=1 Tax=Salinisphaera orenii MK-B5 TaxID=856730 RepID=A0A423PI79_9GAMM|nr:MSMEG_0569 family flavin-dependent oxidoreductase [Salinisphaera orenii]ROO25338.1 FAD-dependent oxidoreductase [Salinisphaera orenii MK-B5]
MSAPQRRGPAIERHWPVVVIGGGQAGLSASYWLQRHGIEHVVIEKNRVGHAWRHLRWDTFCLVTPNWQCRLPGFPYDGDDPHGFMPRDEIVAYLERYRDFVDPPLREGVTVTRVGQCEDEGEDAEPGFIVETTDGTATADQVVLAVNGYHVPRVPRLAERLPAAVQQWHSVDYRNPQSLPAGGVLVVGTGQSGCQIAEDLHLAGRRVHLSVGSAPRAPRAYRGRDSVDWLERMGTYDVTVDEHPEPAGKLRHKANHYMTGRDGGREIDLRRFALEGMQLYGRVATVEADGTLAFEPNLAANLDAADATYCKIRDSIDAYIAAQGIDAPPAEPFVPVWQPPSEPAQLDLVAAGITSVIWATGFASDFRWVELPLFDGAGEPVHRRGVTGVDGAYFLGLPWLNTWGSGRFAAVGADAEHLVERIAERAAAPQRAVS